MIVSCPHCQMQVQNTAEIAGRNATCHGCNGVFGMPPLPLSMPAVVTASTSRRRAPSPSKLPLILGLIGAAVAFLGGAAVIGALATGGAGSKIGLGDPNKEAVRQYLRENLHDPKWEEVEWVMGKHHPRGETMVGLKYRAKNGFGAKMLHVEVFYVQDGQVTHTFDHIPLSYVK